MRVFVAVFFNILFSVYIWEHFDDEELALDPIEEYACMLAIKHKYKNRQINMAVEEVMLSRFGSRFRNMNVSANYNEGECLHIWQRYD